MLAPPRETPPGAHDTLCYPLIAMSHWDYVLIAYGLTAAALVLELVLLFARRRRARVTLEDLQA